jgi:hypothetical protein
LQNKPILRRNEHAAENADAKNAVDKRFGTIFTAKSLTYIVLVHLHFSRAAKHTFAAAKATM